MDAICGFFATITLLLTSCTMGLLLDDDCHVTPHCDCHTGFNWSTDISPTVGVFCEDKFLTRVPSFRNVSYRMTQPWTIDLQSNSISYIPGNAFSNLQEYGNGNNVYVKLGINNLRNISGSAFSGIEPFIIFVGLDENQLQYIPSFVSKLPNLKGLNILYNPIVHIDPLIFISIHRSLETLKISVGDLPAWPQTLNVLTNLESLVIQMKHYEIPSNAFKGLNGTLRRVTILDAGVMDTAAVCSLGLLESLEVSYRRNIHNISGKNIVNCTLPMNSTKDIKINYSTYEQLPIVFRSFPNLESLAYFNSSTRFIDDSLIPPGARVKVFKCMYCKFLSVPGAINLFHFLEYCLLQENGITTVERFSFDNLYYLRLIDLSDNPIMFISRSAFRNLIALTDLFLSNTKLTTVPQAVTTLPNLIGITMGSNITCACGPTWMKQWANSMSKRNPGVFGGPALLGGCQASNETLSHFVLQTIPNCP